LGLDDLAATIMGARWMDVALEGDIVHTTMVSCGRVALHAHAVIAETQLRHMRPGQRASPEQVEAIDRQISAAIVFRNGQVSPQAAPPLSILVSCRALAWPTSCNHRVNRHRECFRVVAIHNDPVAP